MDSKQSEQKSTSRDAVENWVHGTTRKLPTVEPDDSVSQISRRSSSHRSRGSKMSSVASERLRCQQKNAELLARAASLVKKQELELEKLRLKIQEEELDIRTELEVVNARERVLDRFDSTGNRSESDFCFHPVFKVNESDDVSHSKTVSKSNDLFESYDMKQGVKNVGFDLNPEAVPYSPEQVNDSSVNVKSDKCYLESDTNVHKETGLSYPESDNSRTSGAGIAAGHTSPGQVRSEWVSTHLANSTGLPPLDCYRSTPNSQTYRPPYEYHPYHRNQVSCIPDDVSASIERHLRKPSFEVRKFGGNPMEFRKFMRQFKARVVANTDSDEEKMNFLEQLTEGEAARVVSGFSHLDGSEGYPAAIKELEDRYGNTHIIANAFIKKAIEWPAIRPDDVKSLDEFSIFLVECENAVRSIEAMRVLEYPDNLKKIIGKLPFYFHDRWRGVVQHARCRGEIVSFHHLVDFVKEETKKATDPVYGKEALKSDKVTKSFTKSNVKEPNRFKGSFAAGVTDEIVSKKQNVIDENRSSHKCDTRKACIYCDNASHFLYRCKQFGALPIPERFSFLKGKGLCWACLRTGHMKNDCRKPSTCDVCSGKHPTVLHADKEHNESQTDKRSETRSVGNNSPSGVCSHTGTRDPSCAMAIIPVRVKLKNKLHAVDTYAFFDTGSSVSFCTENLLRKLGGSGKRMRLTLNTMGEPITMATYAVTGLQVCDLENRDIVELPKIYTKSVLPVSREHIPTTEEISKWPHLRDVKVPELSTEIELMIGSNVPDAYAPFDVRTGPRGSPHATLTRLGWIVWNIVRQSEETPENNQSNLVVNRVQVAAIQEVEQLRHLEDMLRQSFSVDFPERQADVRRENSVEDNRFLEQVDQSICLVEGHYSIKLPFRKIGVKMPNNCDQGMQRLRSLKQKMLRNEKFGEDYREFMGNIIDKKYAEQVPSDEVSRDDGLVWYIPHHGIYHPRKPGKIRVVFDCSATFQGVSLNGQLLRGPDLTNSLLGVLLRFRENEIAIMADIESMFFQVRVDKADVDLLRFLWWPEGDIDQEPRPYRMLVHLFGAVSSPSCSNFALRRTVEDNANSFDPVVCDTVKNNMYVDDLLASTGTEEKAISLVKGTSDLCKRGGFRLTKWVCSSPRVLESVPVEERAKDVKELDLDSDRLPCERALGVYWDVESDSFGFKIGLQDKHCTRRGILSVVSSIYDPIGLAAPFVLNAKILLQELCKLDIGWDEEVSGHVAKKWQNWLAQLPDLDSIQVKRCYKPVDFGKVVSCQIHHFSDASNVGYGVVSYVRLTNDKNQIHCSFLSGKSRVAPLKKVTIPRLELTAAALAVRMNNMVAIELQYEVTDTFFWTDSMSVLRYICNEKARYHTFVANRVTMIRDSSTTRHWKHVSTKQNPADNASRGLTSQMCLNNQQWLKGPDFLWRDETEWPQTGSWVNVLPKDDVEVQVSNTAVQSDSGCSAIDKLVDHFSDWLRLKRTVGWLLVGMDNLRKRVSFKKQLIKSLESEEADPQVQKEKVEREMSSFRKQLLADSKVRIKSVFLSVDTLDRAEILLVKYAQSRSFVDELRVLRCGQRHLKDNTLKKSSLRNLDPFVSDGVLRVGGRLEKASIPSDAKHPIILSRKSPISVLILRDIHKRIGHLGRNSILAVLKQKYWMIGAAAAIKELVYKCVTCRKYRTSCNEQKMADLPDYRLTPDDPPFTKTGMDYFGPFTIKRGRTTLKRYGVIFTCLVVRAVHLEVACSLDTDSCINAIRRFVARRGPVRMILSDNGTNLVGAERELREEIQKWNTSKIQSFFQQKGITWRFNPPAASHFGGAWERLIRSIRKIMTSLMSEQILKLDDEGLQTLFCEVESILNGRPLTESPDSPHDLEVLTPNHLLLLRPGECFPPGTFKETDTYTRRRWRQIQYLADLFWSRWLQEYLPMLQRFQKWLVPRRNVAVGDIVLVMENSPRNSRSLGRIMEVLKDKKGLVRVVKVKTRNVVLLRPISKLCLILEGDINPTSP